MLAILLLRLSSFARAHWRAVAILGTTILAFLVGRFTVPTRTKTVTQTVYQDRIVEKRIEVKAESETKIVYRDRSVIREANGTVIQRDVERDAQESQEIQKEATARVVERVIMTTKTVDKTHTASRWTVSAGIGAPVQLQSPFIGVPFVIGEAGYRLIGPFSVGLFGELDIKGKNPVVGVTLGISF